MPYEYHGAGYDIMERPRPEPLYPPRPYKPNHMPGNDRLKAATAEMYPNDSRLHTTRPLTAGEQYMLGGNGRRMLQSTAQRFDRVARLIPTGASRETILTEAGWANETAFQRACERHGMKKLWDAMPNSAVKRPRGLNGGRKGGPRGPHKTTLDRLDDIAELLQDPRCSKEEALARTGWVSFGSFARAAYRTGRKHLIRMYHEHGQKVDPIHLVHAGRMAGGWGTIPNGRRMSDR